MRETEKGSEQRDEERNIEDWCRLCWKGASTTTLEGATNRSLPTTISLRRTIMGKGAGSVASVRHAQAPYSSRLQRVRGVPSALLK